MNEAYGYYPELEDEEQFIGGGLWDFLTKPSGQVNRQSPEYIKWVQKSLNKILRLRLAVDGDIGRKTKSAIRNFQSKYGLTVDGIAGSNTERALIKAGASVPPTSLSVSSTTPPSGRASLLALVSTRMPANGLGFTTSNNNNKYGLPETIKALKAIAAEWHSRHADIQFMVRDISQLGGGKFGPHKSHRIGLDVDVQLWIQHQRICMENPNYTKWRPYIQELVSVIHNNPVLPVKTIGFTDKKIKKVSNWPRHTCHLHIRFCMPAKYKSRLNLNLVYRKGERKPNYNCGSQTSQTLTAVSGFTTQRRSQTSQFGQGIISVPIQDMVPGIDVSHWRGHIDWARVAGSGITFAYIKATQGRTFQDNTFRNNWIGAKANRVVRGAYHLLMQRSSSSVESQAQNFLNTVTQAPGDMPPALDLETKVLAKIIAEEGAEDAWKFIYQWVLLVKQRTGYTPIIYMNPYRANKLKFNFGKLSSLALWVPKYGRDPTIHYPTDKPNPINLPQIPQVADGRLVWPKWTIWQYSSKGRVAGIRDHTDLNVFNGNRIDFNRWLQQSQPPI